MAVKPTLLTKNKNVNTSYLSPPEITPISLTQNAFGIVMADFVGQTFGIYKTIHLFYRVI